MFVLIVYFNRFFNEISSKSAWKKVGFMVTLNPVF